MLSSPPKISLLPEHLIDQIKAGEVIERPGSLIKEIFENAIDAGARRLELTLKNNGLDLIHLKDDGHGILSNDLPLAFSRHATSKISRFEDLYRLHSFGFRGEALASIAAISKLQCITFNEQENEGTELRIEGGLSTYSGRRQKNPGQHGTELNVQDLFFNTPARLKFIQSQQAEKNFIKKIIFSFILAHPKVEFVIKFDEEEREVYPCRELLKDRLMDIIPRAKDLVMHTQRTYEDNQLELYLIPGNLRSPVKLQYTFINQRFVLDKQLQRVIGNALISSFGTDDFHFVAFVNLPTDHIDVNVHPNKTIIKLFETSKVISLISGSIKELASGQKPTQSSVLAKLTPSENQSSFNQLNSEAPTLLQERHEYNMEGFFSPHRLPTETSVQLIWIDQFFLYLNDGNWEAISAAKLLAQYIRNKFNSPPSQIIPLLVSEPFKVASPNSSIIKELNDHGLELEKLSADTIVLRSIPDWMNGFPLRDIVSCLIEGKPLENITFNPKDWSQSTWEEMIRVIGINEIREKKVGLDLKKLLMENCK